jgi:ketosteroid isomerase-like protein
MSQENVELVRDVIDAGNRADLDAALKHFDPYVVIRPDANWPENRPSLGHDGARSLFDDLTAALGPGQTVIEEQIDAGDRVVTLVRFRGHGQLSGLQDEYQLTQVHTFRRGKVVMLEYFLDHREALEAAGLSE